MTDFYVMSVTIISQPGEIVFAGNPVEFRFSTDNVLDVAGRPFIGYLAFGALPDVGNGFKLRYSTVELAFSFGIAADDSGLLLTRGTGLTMPAFLAALALELQANFYLDRDFVVEVDALSSRIKLTSRYSDPEFNLQIETVAPISLATAQSAVQSVDKNNFKILAELWVRRFNQGSFYKASQALQEVDSNYEALYDISELLSSELVADGFDTPNLAMVAFEKAERNICEYYIRFAEVYGDKQFVKKVHKTAIKYATLGGFSKPMIRKLSFPGYFIAGNKVKFLSQTPGEVIVRPHPDAKDFLYWINFNGVASAAVSVKVTYSDNSTVSYTAFTFNGLKKYEKLIIPAGMIQLNVQLQDPVKIPVKYDVALVNGAVEVSETKSYLVDYKPLQYGQFYLNLNSFGGYDCRFSYGKKSKEYEVVQQSANRAQVSGYRFMDGEKINYAISSGRKESVTTGYKSKREIKGWEEFFLSENKYCLKNGLAYPVSLASKSIKEFKDGDSLFALTFELDYQFVDEYFTADEFPDSMPTLSQVVGWLPPVVNPNPDNWDDRYYLKTEVYNRAQIDNMIGTLQALINTVDTNTATKINEFMLALQGLAPANHDHDDLYHTRLEIYQLLNQNILFKGPWFADEEQDGVWSLNVSCTHEGMLWQSLVEENYSVPGTDPAKWTQIGTKKTVVAFENEAQKVIPWNADLEAKHGADPSSAIVQVWIADQVQPAATFIDRSTVPVSLVIDMGDLLSGKILII